MSTVRLNDFQWIKIRSFLKADRNAYIGNEADCRRFVEGVLWMIRSGSEWRLLPSEYGGASKCNCGAKTVSVLLFFLLLGHKST